MPGLYRDQAEKKALEARNGVIQARAVIYKAGLEDSLLSSDLIREFQRLAINQIYSCAGEYRTGPVEIFGVDHVPPSWEVVPALVAELCSYVQLNWDKATAVHLSSYAMWKVNWIHPFFGGNGRTSRAVSYFVLCRRLGFVLPGDLTIPDQIQAERLPYYRALQAADTHWKQGVLDLSEMETLLGSMLAKQLVAIHSSATGKTPPVR